MWGLLIDFHATELQVPVLKRKSYRREVGKIAFSSVHMVSGHTTFLDYHRSHLGDLRCPTIMSSGLLTGNFTTPQDVRRVSFSSVHMVSGHRTFLYDQCTT